VPRGWGRRRIALGEATKTVPFVMDGRKTYQFTVSWGSQTDTDDTEGKVIATEAVEMTRRYLASHGVTAEVEFSWAATEVKVPDLVDAIVDATETGPSLRATQLPILATLLDTLAAQGGPPMLVLTGHDHLQHVDSEGPYVLVDGGSVGAGGAFGVGEELSGFALVHLDAQNRARAVDLVEVEPASGSASAHRVVLAPPAPAAPDAEAGGR